MNGSRHWSSKLLLSQRERQPDCMYLLMEAHSTTYGVLSQANLKLISLYIQLLIYRKYRGQRSILNNTMGA